ncbi:MAG TPA: tRNA pseudouridine(55) synthase TruB [Ignavibacteria bacterium]|nr:tRNA pseudouridine(55) synthase TruB [Ignavibacteria bacterium]
MNIKSEKSENKEPVSPYSNKIFLIDKPIDFTSFDIVRIFKKKFNLKKAGHSGTLDPKATGLLIICSDKMTKKINEFIEYDKEYEGIIRIGARTKSFDTESREEEVIENVKVTDEEIEKVRKTFLGEIEQMPPMFSALKHNGKPLYKLARAGKEIERKQRTINVSEFEIEKKSESELKFRISSSKGTYIRSIANDFGERLGVGGYLKELRRTRIGNFKLGDFKEMVKDIRFTILEL